MTGEHRPRSPLRLSLDVSAVPDQPVGAGRYTLELARALAARDDVELTLWCRRDDIARWRALGPRDTPIIRAESPRTRPARLMWEQLCLSTRLRAMPVDVHHSPHYTMPGGPLARGASSARGASPARVVTVHDLTFFDHPEWHERTKVLVFRRAIRLAARQADAVVCVSRRTAERFEELCAPTGRVFVIPHGVDRTRFRPYARRDGLGEAGTRSDEGSDEGPDEGSDEEALRVLGIQAPYVLFVGTLEPRKAVPDVVAAFERLAAGRPGLSLVLAGRPGWGAAAVNAAIARSRVADRIVRTGYVPDEALPALLRRASVAVYPALEEGFGLPALEALACGTALITTVGTPMAEIAGDAAMLVPPGSISDLAGALETVVNGDPEQPRRRQRGFVIVAAHTWEASAEHHMSAYRWVAARADDMAPGRRAGAR
jgi:glycosyltransferase involved in cell wall biosynthesis